MSEQLSFSQGRYQTSSQSVPGWVKAFPSLVFYAKFLQQVVRGNRQARQGRYDGAAWSQNSISVLRALEAVGVYIEISGIAHLQRVAGPCVVIANHMSMLETMLLPGIIQPIKPVTFVVKHSLLDYPVFGQIMRARDPIAVTRHNPRHDFAAVMEGGLTRLQAGQSIIIFPQTTRTLSFEPAQFNTIGIKLARKAGVPVIPLALITDAWENGKWLKDFGRIDPTKRVSFTFGAPLEIHGRGDAEHQQVLDFIQACLKEGRTAEARELPGLGESPR